MNAEILHDALNLLPGDLITATDKLRSVPQKKKRTWMRYASMAACIALILYGGFLFSTHFLGMGGSTESAMNESFDLEAPAAQAQEKGNEAPMADAPAAAPAETKAPIPTGAPSNEKDCYGEIEESHIEIPLEPNESFDGSTSIYVGGSAGYSVTYGHKEGVDYPQVTVIRSRQELEDYYDEYRDYYDIDSLEDGCVHWTESFFAEYDLLMVLLKENDGYECPEIGWLNELENGSWELTFQGYFEVGDGIDAETPWHVYAEIEKALIAPEDTILLVFE